MLFELEARTVADEDHSDGRRGSGFSSNLEKHLAVAREAGALDAVAFLLEKNSKWHDALEVSLRSMGDIIEVIRLVAAAPEQLAPDLFDLVVHASSCDARSFSLLIVCLLMHPWNGPGGGLP